MNIVLLLLLGEICKKLKNKLQNLFEIKELINILIFSTLKLA